MQSRHLTGEETNPEKMKKVKEMNGGMLILTNLCLAMRSDPLGLFRGLGDVVTGI